MDQGPLALHSARTSEEFRRAVAHVFGKALGSVSAALLFADEEGLVVEAAVGDALPYREGQRVEEADVFRADRALAPMTYGDSGVGYVVAEAEADSGQLVALARVCAVALVNLRVYEDALRASDQYFASLSAFEQGVRLFQEENGEAVGARFLQLVGSVLGSQTGALYQLETIGDPSSGLRLSQALGVPETMLEDLRTLDGEWWPPQVVGGAAQLLERDRVGGFGELDAGRLPPALSNVVALPLRYHGIDAGVALSFNVETESGDQRDRLESVRRLGDLGAALFHRLSIEEDSVRNKELQTQLEIAGKIQGRLMPKDTPDSSRFELAWSSRPAQHIGGDYVDWLADDDGDLYTVIADVSGHGVNSALLMSSFRAAYRSKTLLLEPGDLLEHLNEEVSNEVGDTGMFITAASFKFDPDGRRFSYASAGHNPVLIYRAATGEIDELDSTGPSLGFFAGMTFDCIDNELATGDVLLLYTDGVVEQCNAADEMFGDDRLAACLRDAASGSVQALLERVIRDVEEFAGGTCRDDDVSLLVLKAT